MSSLTDSAIAKSFGCGLTEVSPLEAFYSSPGLGLLKPAQNGVTTKEVLQVYKSTPTQYGLYVCIYIYIYILYAHVGRDVLHSDACSSVNIIRKG